MPEQYIANFGKNLIEVLMLKRWAWSGMGIYTGAKSLSGTSFSELTIDGSKTNFSDPKSVPRSMYTYEVFYNSALFSSFWMWYFKYEVSPGLNVNGTIATGVNVVNASAPSTRIVVHGLCNEHVQKTKSFLASVPQLSALVTFDFAHLAIDTIAIPTKKPNDKTNAVKIETQADLNSYGTKSAAWPWP